MNLIQRQLKVVSLSSKLEIFISQQLNITRIFRYVPLTSVCNYIATSAIEQSEDYDDVTQCLIALACCAEVLPADRNPTQNIALHIIKAATEQYPQLQPMLDKLPAEKNHLSMLS